MEAVRISNSISVRIPAIMNQDANRAKPMSMVKVVETSRYPNAIRNRYR